MNETDGLLAQAQVEREDNQQQEEQTISHQLPDTEPSLDDVTVAKEGEEVELSKPDWYPDKFWNDEEGPELEKLVKSYNEIVKKFSQGKHKVPEQYDDTVLKNAGIPEDDELADYVKSWSKENGVSQSAFEDLASKFISMSQLEAEQGQVSFEEEYKKLGNNADATIKSMTDWAQGLVRKGVWSEADFEEFKIMGGTAQGIRALQKVRSYYGDKPIPVDVGPIDGAPSKEELMAMVGKPEYNSDPAYRAKVEKMFEQVYGSQEYSAI
jgi:hypothetical protein